VSSPVTPTNSNACYPLEMKDGLKEGYIERISVFKSSYSTFFKFYFLRGRCRVSYVLIAATKVSSFDENNNSPAQALKIKNISLCGLVCLSCFSPLQYLSYPVTLGISSISD
jgi:hypothetical protein